MKMVFVFLLVKEKENIRQDDERKRKGEPVKRYEIGAKYNS